MKAQIAGLAVNLGEHKKASAWCVYYSGGTSAEACEFNLASVCGLTYLVVGSLYGV